MVVAVVVVVVVVWCSGSNDTGVVRRPPYFAPSQSCPVSPLPLLVVPNDPEEVQLPHIGKIHICEI